MVRSVFVTKEIDIDKLLQISEYPIVICNTDNLLNPLDRYMTKYKTIVYVTQLKCSILYYL